MVLTRAGKDLQCFQASTLRMIDLCVSVGVLNVRAIVGALNQEKALVGLFCDCEKRWIVCSSSVDTFFHDSWSTLHLTQTHAADEQLSFTTFVFEYQRSGDWIWQRRDYLQILCKNCPSLHQLSPLSSSVWLQYNIKQDNRAVSDVWTLSSAACIAIVSLRA